MMKYKVTYYSLISSIVASIGGFLFGFNQTIIAGAILFLEKEFHLSTIGQQFLVSILILAALFGASIGGFLADKIGRKNSLFFTTALFILGSFIASTADTLLILIIARIIIGFAIGIVSIICPLYIAEMSDPGHRGILVSLNQFAITLGILCAYIINYVFSPHGEWKSMFGVAIFPAFLLLIGLFFISETPSYLAFKGQNVLAEKIFRKIRKDADDTEIANLHLTEEKKSLKHIFDKNIKKALFMGIILSVLQQFSGINGVLFYAPKIFQMAGFSLASTAILASISIGIINVLSTIIALWLIDLVGRRVLLITGLIGMSFTLTALGISFMFVKKFLTEISIVSIVLYIAFFAISLGPIVWLIISEIFPLEIRGRAMSIAGLVNWLA
ncbi:MAG: hypothetical protein A2888_01105, partial [Chlamydiae bacterium RIFCSPLOWO2_01_FULL_28_7]